MGAALIPTGLTQLAGFATAIGVLWRPLILIMRLASILIEDKITVTYKK